MYATFEKLSSVLKGCIFCGILVSLLMVASDMSRASVTGSCSNCHTMHNSQGGASMAFEINTGHTGYVSDESPNPLLLLTDCVGCHTALGGSTWKDSTTGAPIVFNTGEPSEYLAGGNFYWVAQAGGDARGHNVLGISGTDSLAVAPGGTDCGNDNCHKSLAVALSGQNASLKGGCEGCHLNVMHHANDGTGTKKLVNTAEQGWYRFLAGHTAGPVQNKGVKGIEDSDWQYTKDTNDHNEYLGVPVIKTGSTSLTNGSMTAFCCGCHTNFHSSSTDSGSQSPWLRHPSDFVIPNTGEYTNAFGASGGTGFYDPLVPVARPSLPATDPNLVNLGDDMVMCLSCHRAHGSPYYKLMRWDYKNWPGSGINGCAKCHTSKS